MRDYRTLIPMWAKILGYGFSAFLALNSLVFFISDYSENIFLRIVLGLVIFTAGAILMYLVRHWKLQITDTQIISQEYFTEKRLSVADIKGYRTLDNYVIIEPISESLPKLRISIPIWGKKDFISWLTENFQNLDLLDMKNSQEDILSDETFGSSEEERSDSLRRAQAVVRILTILSIAISFVEWFAILPLIWIYTVSFIFPAILLAVYWYFDGLVKLSSDDKKSVYPSLSLAFIFPVMVLDVRALLDFHVSHYLPVLGYSVGMSLVILVFFYAFPRQVYRREPLPSLVRTGVVSVAFMYSFAATIFYNCRMDDSKGIVYIQTVRDKRVIGGKHMSYMINVGAWGVEKEDEVIDVGSKIYKSVHVGDRILIISKPGKLGAGWYQISLPSKQ